MDIGLDALERASPGWEKRWHPLRREWVVYAAHRNSRPWHFPPEGHAPPAPAYAPDCHLCPGNRRVSGTVNPSYEGVYVFDNDHPVVGPSAPDIPAGMDLLHGGLYRRERAGGIARVVCFDPRHHVSFPELGAAQAVSVFATLRDQMRGFLKEDAVRSVLVFENKGELVGVSNPHPHCQIYGLDFHYHLFTKEMHALELHRSEKGGNLFADILAAELSDGSRIVAENRHAVAFIPFFARFAYEAYVFPKRRHATLATLGDEELEDLAAVFQELTRRYDANFRSSFPYVMAFAQAPVDGGAYGAYHMHMVVCPPLRQPGLRKHLAGPETGGDTFMADTIPEEKAAELRNIRL